MSLSNRIIKNLLNNQFIDFENIHAVEADETVRLYEALVESFITGEGSNIDCEIFSDEIKSLIPVVGYRMESINASKRHYLDIYSSVKDIDIAKSVADNHYINFSQFNEQLSTAIQHSPFFESVLTDKKEYFALDVIDYKNIIEYIHDNKNNIPWLPPSILNEDFSNSRIDKWIKLNYSTILMIRDIVPLLSEGIDPEVIAQNIAFYSMPTLYDGNIVFPDENGQYNMYEPLYARELFTLGVEDFNPENVCEKLINDADRVLEYSFNSPHNTGHEHNVIQLHFRGRYSKALNDETRIDELIKSYAGIMSGYQYNVGFGPDVKERVIEIIEGYYHDVIRPALVREFVVHFDTFKSKYIPNSFRHNQDMRQAVIQVLSMALEYYIDYFCSFIKKSADTNNIQKPTLVFGRISSTPKTISDLFAANNINVININRSWR